MARPIKADSADFTKDEFYLIQTSGPDQRYVASFQDKSKIHRFMTDFINKVEDEVEVRIIEFDESQQPIQFSGIIQKTELLSIVAIHDEVIFHHGKYDFMLRNSQTEEYFAFDEHGLLFIYTDQDYSEILHQLGAERRQDEPLIYEYDHWHIGLPEGEEKFAALINDSNLEQD